MCSVPPGLKENAVLPATNINLDIMDAWREYGTRMKIQRHVFILITLSKIFKNVRMYLILKSFPEEESG